MFRMLGLDVAQLALMIPIVAILGGVFLAALKILKGDRAGGGPASQADDTRLIQDVYRGLQKMEDRIDALETILLDRERSRRKAND